MKNIFFCFFLFTGPLLFGQNHWAQKAGGIGFDIGYDIAADLSGNIYSTGVCFDNGTYGSIAVPASFPFSYDVFVAKYNAEGIAEWAKQWGGGSTAEGLGITWSGNGIGLCGSFNDSIFFDGNALYAEGMRDIFVCLLDTSGNILWAKSAGGIQNDRATSITIDNNNNVIVTGSFTDSVLFDGTYYYSHGAEDIFVAKYNSSGAIQWVKTFGGPTPANEEEGTSITSDANDFIYITGSYYDSCFFDNDTMISYGAYDVLVVCFDDAGNIQWKNHGGGTSSDAGQAIRINNQNEIIVGGYCTTSGNIIFDQSTFTGAGGNDIFIARYDVNGNLIRVIHDGGSMDEEIYALSLDGSGNYFITGRFLDSANFGGVDYISNGSYDVFAAIYDSTGNVIDCNIYGGIVNDIGYGIVYTDSGNAVATGWFDKNAMFENTSMTSSNADVFLVTVKNQISNPQGITFQSFHTGNSSIGSNNVTDIIIDAIGNPWVSFSDSGVAYFNGLQWNNYTTQNSGIPSNSINGMYLDSIGTLWLATEDNGIAGYDGTNWISYNTSNSSLPVNSFQSITGRRGNPSLWTGSSSSGCIRYNLTTGVSTAFTTSNSNLPGDEVNFMASDSSGAFWIGTKNNGVGYFNAGTITPFTTLNSALPDDHINSIFVENNKTWFATDSGYASYDGTWTVFNMSTGEIADKFNDINSLANGGVISATKKKGTVVNDGSVQLRFANTSNFLFNNNIKCIATDQVHGNVWMGVQYNGIVLLNDSSLINRIRSNDLKITGQITISPSPSTTTIHVKANLSNKGKVKVYIQNTISSSGKTYNLGVQMAGDFSRSFNISDLSSGVYQVKIETENQILVSQFIKVK